jgi:hypothetical protein
VNGLGHPAGQPAAHVFHEIAGEYVLWLQVNAAIVQGKEYPMHLPVSEILVQPESG